MKILRLDLRAFGPFTNVELDLSAGSEGLHAIFGPNEAGKSSALRALEQMLFGIPTRSADDFLHSYQSLRVGASLEMPGRAPIRFLRRKGAKNTLLAEDGETPLEDGTLRPFLGGLDRELFATMFGLGHEQLVRGGREIVAGSGDVGQVLFAAGSGVADLQSVLGDLESRVAELYLPRGQKQRINQALKALDEARKRMRQAQLPSEEWGRHEEALRVAELQTAQAEQRLAAVSQERNRLERIRQALPAITTRKETLRKIEGLGKVVVLPSGFADQRRGVTQDLAIARQAHHRAQEEFDRWERELQAVVVPEALLAIADQVERLPDELGSYRKAQRDLPGLRARREQLLRHAAAILRQVRPELALEEAGRLQLTEPQRMTIQRLSRLHDAIAERLAQAQEEMRQTEQAWNVAQRALAAAEPPRPPAALRNAVRRAQSQGDLEQQFDEAQQRLEALNRTSAADLAKLRLWSGSLADLARLPLPSAETIERIAAQMAACENSRTALAGSLQAAEDRKSAIGRQLDELRLQGEVPSEGDLAAARRTRDAGWQLVAEACRQAEPDAERLAAFLANFPGEQGLIAAYARAVAAADEVSDRLRREASRVAQRAALVAECQALDRQLEKLRPVLDRAEAEHCRLGEEWRAIWEPAGIEPLFPQEMQAWLVQVRGFVQQADSIASHQRAVEQIHHRIASHCRELEQSLASLDASVDSPSAGGLRARLGHAESVLDRLDSASARRSELERESQRLATALAAAKAKAVRAQEESSQWRDQWGTALEPLALSADTPPETALHVVEQILQLLGHLREADDVVERIEDIGRDADALAASVAALVERAGPDLSGRPVEQAAEQLIARLRKATADRQRRDEARQQQRRYRSEIDAHQRSIDQLAARLATMCLDAGCREPEELPAAESASQERVALGDKLRDAEDQLAAASAGGALESFLREADAENADALPLRIEELSENIRRLEVERDALKRTVWDEQAALRAMDGRADAADAAEEVQVLLARIEADAGQYLRLQLARAVLREAIERYRKRAEGPVLRRAGELFQRLTRGSFARLTVDFDDQGRSVLKGVRPGKGETVELSGMSEGTGDQLYLALRLASLENYLEGKDPVPFIVDDVLISFDDQRAQTALEVLAEFSRRTQVIFFTHHAHLVRLAEEHLDRNVLFVHNLPGRG